MLNLENGQEALRTDEEMIRKLEDALDAVTEGEGVEYEAEVSLYLVNDEAIRAVNQEHRGIDAPTDVLSFPFLAYQPGRIFSQTYDESTLRDEMFLEDRLLLGDILISGERAVSQAKEYGHSELRETVFLFVHSLLHLLGYDHMDEASREKMVEKEEHYMTRIGVNR